MKPFEFIDAKSVKETCSLLSKYKGEAKILAAGQSRKPLLRQGFITPKYLISIKRIKELDYIAEDKDCVRIGAITTENTVEKSVIIKRRFPMLIEMEGYLGAVQIRNWGTIGGSLAFSDPSGDAAVALIALGATVKIVNTRGQREVPVEDFETGYLENVLEEDELLTEITIPFSPPNSGAAFTEEAVRTGDLGIAIVAAMVTLDAQKTVKNARIVLGAQSVSSFRAKKAESLMVGKKLGDNLDKVVEAAASEACPPADVLGSVEYKLEIIKVLTKRAVNLAISRAAK